MARTRRPVDTRSIAHNNTNPPFFAETAAFPEPGADLPGLIPARSDRASIDFINLMIDFITNIGYDNH
jgi:hypothetical protein